MPGDLLAQSAGQFRVGGGVAAVLLPQSYLGVGATVGEDAVGIRVDALPEQGSHLRLAHLTRHSQQRLGVGDPLPRGHALHGVVVAQLPVGGAQLVPSAELVDGHHTPDLNMFNLVYQ